MGSLGGPGETMQVVRAAVTAILEEEGGREKGQSKGVFFTDRWNFLSSPDLGALSLEAEDK